ncbi:MAG: AAA domain-containing protein [Pseudomonadota bacterium]
MLGSQTQLKRTFDGELCGFFETWLDGQYRRSEEEGELSHLLCFPVVHLAKGELAGLLRCGLRLRFASGDGKAFKPPTRAERQRRVYPLPPDEVRLTRAPKVEAAWPLFIDTRLLRQPLGVPAESIDALFEALRTLEDATEQQMLALLTTTLEWATTRSALEPASALAHAALLRESVARESCELAVWLERLTAAMRRLLLQSSSRARVYAVGIVVDGTQAKTTWHLQREINALLDAEAGHWKVESPLGAYLTGRPQAEGQAPQRALFPGPGLTTSQRAAAEHFWGSSLSAVQGPPGTGKTSLILHLCAESLLRQVEALVDGGRMGSSLFLITSSNNRAVDNVIEPLSGGELPLALRAGSRQACEQQLAAGLRRTLTWLKRAETASLGERLGRLTQACEQFRARRAELDLVLAPRRAALELLAKRARVERELESLSAPNADSSNASALNLSGVTTQESKAILAALIPLEKRLQTLSKLCEVAPGHAPLRRYNATSSAPRRAICRSSCKQSKARACASSCRSCRPSFKGQASAEQQLERWEEAAEQCLSQLDQLRAGFERGKVAAQQAEQRLRLRAELEALAAAAVPTPVTPDHEPLSRALFDAAASVREAWAAQEAAPLVKAVATALRTVEQERSLRPLFRNEADSARWLCRLFNIWGSTLLSLGNCFPSDLGSVARLVIDEAGQCHPAHAVSALLRADSALVIGDVHQLTPVIELGADDEASLVRTCKLESLASRLEPYRVHADAQVSTQALGDRAVAQRLALVDHFRCQARNHRALRRALPLRPHRAHAAREPQRTSALLDAPRGARRSARRTVANRRQLVQRARASRNARARRKPARPRRPARRNRRHHPLPRPARTPAPELRRTPHPARVQPGAGRNRRLRRAQRGRRAGHGTPLPRR